MIKTTLDGKSVLILTARADWASAISTGFELLSVSEIGLSAMENRAGLSVSLRTTIKYSSTLFEADAEEFDAALKAYNNEPVLVPFWPCTVPFEKRSVQPVTSGIRIWFEPDWSKYLIGLDSAGNPAGYSANARTAPLLWCRFSKIHGGEAINGNGSQVYTIEALDVGPAAYALTARAVGFDYGPTVGGAATPRIPQSVIHWSRPSAGFEIQIKRERIGYGRGEVETYVEQVPRQTQKLAVRCMSADEIASIIQLFADRGGNVRPFWCPSHKSTDLAQSLLVRMKTPKLSLSWTSPTYAEASIEVVGLPTEAAPPAGEVVGATVGAMPSPWWGYVVQFAGNTYRYTSHESSIDAGALGVFAPAPISHGDRTSELNLAKHECSIEIGAFDGSPFERLRFDPLCPVFKVTVIEGTITAPANAKPIWSGDLTGLSFVGSKLTASISGLTALMDMQVPIALASPRCWAPLFSPKCGLARTGVAATLSSINSNGELVFNVSTTVASDRFRYGFAENSTNQVRVSIAGNTGVTGSGEITVKTLAPLGVNIADGWMLYPGCDHSYSRCTALGNSANFRGFPHFPKANPALIAVKQTTPSGGKK